MEEKKHSIAEQTLFLAGVTFLGGFHNAYTYATRNGVFSNMHTSNMSKLGIMLAEGNWSAAGKAFLAVFACICGAFLCEVFKNSIHHRRDWRQNALLAEMAALLLVALIPASFPDLPVTTFMSVVTGFQLCLFRNSLWGAHNTTICTGNLRTVGQYAYSAVKEHTPSAVERFLKYTGIVFSFSLGAAVGTPISKALGTPAAAVAAALSGLLALAMSVKSGSRATAA